MWTATMKQRLCLILGLAILILSGFGVRPASATPGIQAAFFGCDAFSASGPSPSSHVTMLVIVPNGSTIGSGTFAVGGGSYSGKVSINPQQANGTLLYYVVYDSDANGVPIGNAITFPFTTCVGRSANNSVDMGDARLNGDPVAPIVVYCATNNGVAVFVVNSQSVGELAFTATNGQIANALALAVSTQKNVLITGARGASLFALSSNELQAHTEGPRPYDFVFQPGRCGITPSVLVPIVTTTTTTVTTTTGTTVAAVPTNVSGSPIARSSTYVVQPGDNLFRISLRAGVTMRAIAAANGINNINRIFVGQVLVIP
jgi:LysM repeat protein